MIIVVMQALLAVFGYCVQALPGHTNDQITGTAYRRVGEIAEPTK